jgi:hypothetical protein
MLGTVTFFGVLPIQIKSSFHNWVFFFPVPEQFPSPSRWWHILPHLQNIFEELALAYTVMYRWPYHQLVYCSLFQCSLRTDDPEIKGSSFDSIVKSRTDLITCVCMYSMFIYLFGNLFWSISRWSISRYKSN